MAHEIMQNDKMFSVKEKPWHGLGEILVDYPTIQEAIQNSGLSWKTSLEPLFVDFQDQKIQSMDYKGIVREDTQDILGIVGNRYQIYQNEDMFNFIEEFQKQSGIQLETAGSLRNGKTTWVLAKSDIFESVSNDPIEKYFLFKNSFDGSSPISILFTNIRVVCNNTLSAAINRTKNIFNIKHTASTQARINEAQKALGVYTKYENKFQEALTNLSKKEITESRTKQILEEVIFPLKPVKTEVVGSIGNLDNTDNPSNPDNPIDNIFNMVQMDQVGYTDTKEYSKRYLTQRQNKIDKIMELVDIGAGTNIPGVKGTLYGLYNACTEYADHDKGIRLSSGRIENEAKFENVFWGSGHNFKLECFDKLVKM